MSPTTIRPSGATERREAVVSRVFDAVEDLLTDGHTYVGLSVATIAERAGVARSTFYVHFADKTELLVRLAEATTEDIFAAAYEWVDATGSLDRDGDGPPPTLLATCERIVADYRRHAAVLGAVLAATGYDPAVAEWWRARIQTFADTVADALRQAQLLGLVARDVDVHVLSTMAAWAIERTVSQEVAVSDADGDAALAAGLARGLELLVFGDAPGRVPDPS